MVCAWERHLAQSTGWAGRQDFPFQEQGKLKFAPAGLETTLPLESTLGIAPAAWEPTGSHCCSLQSSLSTLGPCCTFSHDTQHPPLIWELPVIPPFSWWPPPLPPFMSQRLCANFSPPPLFCCRQQEYNQDINKSNLADQAGKTSHCYN